MYKTKDNKVEAISGFLISKVLSAILEYAAITRPVTMEPLEKGAKKIRCRIDGVLREIMLPPARVLRFYLTSQIDEHRIPQDKTSVYTNVSSIYVLQLARLSEQAVNRLWIKLVLVL